MQIFMIFNYWEGNWRNFVCWLVCRNKGKRQQNILNSEETKNIEDNKAGGTKLVRLETKAAAELVSAGEFDKEMTGESCEKR